MALLILRAIFVMVSVGIAVLIFNSGAMQSADIWVPWAVLAAMVALPLTVIGIDGLIRRKDLTTITAVYFGLLIGVFLAYVAMLALTPILPMRSSDPLRTWLPLILGCVLCYVCTSLLLQTRDDFRFLIPFVEFARDVRGLRPNVLDMTTIIDGRIADLAEAGVFESRFVVPSFVLDELQTAASSADKQHRTRGRRGLDVLARLRSNETIDIDVIAPRDTTEDLSLESRVVDLARQLGGRIVTIDSGLAKLAGVQTVPTININDVSLALKPTFVPGDALNVRLVKQGEEPDQGVGYLDDGTMVVVENAREQIGRTVQASVTSTLQTSAGRLVFARPLSHSA
ncbi:MAG: TRAM domain-containing protein [Planctomycetia bacterium]|nr:TRAM domain-containing protein [Planctomycetia bacterium]